MEAAALNLRLAFSSATPAVRALQHNYSAKPALLASFVYWKSFVSVANSLVYRDVVMDSGAFSAYNIGKEIKLQEYIDCCKQAVDLGVRLTEIFALDVIGDWRMGVRNCEEMWKQGVEAIPCFHYGEPESLLLSLARDYPKIAIGGMVGINTHTKNKFIEQCFARIYPKPVHGFGIAARATILNFPFDSVDASTWATRALRFGQMVAFNKARSGLRGSRHNLQAEVAYYLQLEKEANSKWRNQNL